MLLPNCSKDILDIENKNELASGNWCRTKSDFLMALNSCYGPIASKGTFKFGFNCIFQSYSDWALHENINIDMLEVHPANTLIKQTWSDLDTGVYRTSRFIEQAYDKGAAGIEKMGSVMFKNYVAQAKALRRVYYFYLVTLFNEPVFYNEKNIPKDVLQPHSNGLQVSFWRQIEQDMEESIPYLKYKDELPESEMGRVTKGGARAMLAKALLYKHYHFYCKNNN